MTDLAPSASLAGFAMRKSAPPDAKEGDITRRIAVTAAKSIEPAAAPPPRPAPSSEPPPRAEEIVVYWERLRRGRTFPTIGEVDRGLVAKAWPDSLIVVFERDAAIPRISRLGATDGAIEYTPMVTDWICRARATRPAAPPSSTKCRTFRSRARARAIACSSCRSA